VVNKQGDQYEQEADHISEQVMRMPEPQIQRACTCGGACSECQTEQPDQEHERLQTKRIQASDTGQIAAPPIVNAVLRSPGQPLDTAARAFMESRFGHDFSQVRVHTNSQAATSAKAIRARAYTVGSNVAFADSQFSPATTKGKKLLAHELAHVVQQSNGATAIQRAPDPDDDFYRAFEKMPQWQKDKLTERFQSVGSVARDTGALVHLTGGPPGVAAEKYSEPLEKAYRRVGQTYRADAIQGCRLYGTESCLMILTEGEARAAYELAKEGYSPREAATQKAKLQPSVQRLARSSDEAAAAVLPVVMGGGAGSATRLGATVLAVLPAAAIVAVTALFAAGLRNEILFSRFVRLLEENGFITLLNPLGACIGACHAVKSKVDAAVLAFMAAANVAMYGPRPVPKPKTTFDPIPVPAPKTPEKDKEQERRRKRKRPPFVLRLPQQKASHLERYHNWLGVLQSDPHYDRGDPSQPEQQQRWHDAHRIGGSHGIPCKVYERGHVLGLTGRKGERRIRIPDWSRHSKSISMQVDHIIELQLTPASHRSVFDDMDNYELLDSSSNVASRNILVGNIRAERAKQEAFDPSAVGRVLPFDEVTLDGGTAGERWISSEIRDGEQLDAFEKMRSVSIKHGK
jgi:hypothetical protein